jgi:D-alanine-D-alanine ligase
LRYPLFVKPANEGTGMGIGPDSVVSDARQLRKQVQHVIATYHQPALVEEFMSGREFTVGYIGNRGSAETRRNPALYNGNGYHIFPVLEIDTEGIETEGVYGVEAKSIDVRSEDAPGYLCPADIPVMMWDRLGELTIRAAEAIGARDVSRVDFRLDDVGVPHILEINTLPGLNREQSDLCIMAAAEDVPYNTLITEILYLAAERYGMHVPAVG